MDCFRLIIKNSVAVILLKIANLIWSKTESSISEIIDSGYPYLQYLFLRFKYSWEEYEQQRIPKTFRRFYAAILISLNAWFNIIFLTIYSNTESSIWINLKDIEKIIDCERFDLLVIAFVILFGIGEYTWFCYFRQAITYKMFTHKIIYKNLHFDDTRLATNYRRYIFIHHLFIKISAHLCGAFIITGIIVAYVIDTYIVIQAYINNQITIGKLTLCFFIFPSLAIQFISIITMLLAGTFASSFFVEFLKIRMKQFYIFLKHNESSKNIPKLKFNWNCIHREYVELYDETALFDKSISFALLNMETASKILSITACVFYSRQTKMSPTNTMIMLGISLAFVYTAILYSRLVFAPKYNHHYCRLLLNRMARKSIVKYHNRHKNLIIKSNLFIQTMSDNHFGFHCGQIFFITKFQVVELFMMNLPLIILFYKKICMAK
ncbi:hypothetical protein HUG17_9090 [Dermatophagoides farinae]|uniref:Uncharacterized protein n=1 Tax=Dermatophagoides farinae TaxID=6954 RepID=A0A9D4SDT1_DERFA|nr:hypothetical protein HUG17_9090 [Dermatophagoides farinae]